MDAREVDKFRPLGDAWWDEDSRKGTGPLHAMNPVRISYIREHMGVEGARVLDVGCGGGLAAESLARLGAHVTAVDPSEGV